MQIFYIIVPRLDFDFIILSELHWDHFFLFKISYIYL
jgi:hypothetical protein